MTDELYRLPDGEVFQGRIIGINEFGKLLLQTKSGIKEFDTKEVQFII